MNLLKETTVKGGSFGVAWSKTEPPVDFWATAIEIVAVDFTSKLSLAVVTKPICLKDPPVP